MKLWLTNRMHRTVEASRHHNWVLLTAFLLLAIFCNKVVARAAAGRGNVTAQAVQSGSSKDSKNDISGYVGSQACAGCHIKIYNEYVQTSMGRSMSEITPALLQKLHLPGNFVDQKLNRRYEVYTKDGKVYESEYQTDEAGKEVFRDTHPLQWMIGSGASAFGAIVQRGNYLFEAPLTFYTKPQIWASSPGYEFADYGFTRPILAGCLACHSGRINPVPNTNGRYQTVPFSELAIGCEKCHGPGSAHIKAMSSPGSWNEKNVSIVNPAHLTPELANNLCMACHEIGDERILQPGKTYGDIRPGVPLDNTLSILMVAPDRKSPPPPDHLQHYYSMTLSKCYRASNGRLRCITCHDPHVQPSSQQAPSFYNQRCLTCHTQQNCKLPVAARQQADPPNNCIGCHMQKRDVTFIAHVSLTNHRIVVRPDEPLPDVMFQQTTKALPDLIHLDPAPGKDEVAPSLLTLLQAYGELTTYKPEYVDAYVEVLDRIGKTEPENGLVQAALGSRDLKEGKFSEAVAHFEHSLQLGPPQATVYADLSAALEKLGRSDEALSAQQKAIQQDPYNPILQKRLALLFIQGKQYANARITIEHYLDTFPQDSFMRRMLARANGQAQPQ
jgi:hypothetical protein